VGGHLPGGADTGTTVGASRGTFGEDLAFLDAHTRTVVIASGDNQVVVCPQYQGRVMTSSSSGANGLSHGWINRSLIESGKVLSQFNPLGGEDRIWVGPEGGQYSVYFSPGDPFDLDHWQVPAAFDREPFEVLEQSSARVRMASSFELTNYSGFRFEVRLVRVVRVWEREDVNHFLSYIVPDSVKFAAFTSGNRIQNVGKVPWEKSTGLLSIWILGMYPPSDGATVILPFQLGPELRFGPIVNDAYFGRVPEDRIAVRDGVIFFKADGRHRSKIGINHRRSLGKIGSFDADRKILTIVLYNRPQGAPSFVNSMWEIQELPYAGDAVNSYNDGPPAPGRSPLGPFYELETSSPGAALEAEKFLQHDQTTIHLEGPLPELDAIARSSLGVSLKEIGLALP